MKYVKQSKRHIVLDDFEWRALVKGINEYRKQVIDEDGCVEVVNDLLIKIIDAPTKKTRLWRYRNEKRLDRAGRCLGTKAL